jgi:GT2 family glycosyltransferase
VKPKYRRVPDWKILQNEKKIWYLENQGQPKSRIIIDAVIKTLIESSDANSDDEIYLQNTRLLDEALQQENNSPLPITSQEFLQTFFQVFTRVGALATEGEIPPTRQEKLPPDPVPLNRLPLVSVLVVTCNGSEHLPGLLDSLKQQTYPNLEIIIIDNHSDDNSFAYIKENFPGIGIFRNSKNLGHGAAFNIGLEKAKGDLILHLDDDIVVEKDTISKLVHAAMEKEKWAALAPKIKFFHNRAFINSMGNSIHKTDWGSDNFINHVDLGQFDHFSEPFSACFAAVLLNRETIAKIGSLDEFYMVYYDDVDWCFRAQVNGFPVYIVPEAEVFHKFGGTMRKNKKFFQRKWELVIGNRLYFTIKNFETKTIRDFLPRYLLEDMKNISGSLVKGKLRLLVIYFKAYARFLSALPRVLRKRKEVQKLREDIPDALLLSKNVPINHSISKEGIPRLDVHSLCLNYIAPGRYLR